MIRENTEGVYMDMGGVFKKDTPDEVATQEDINTRKGVERVIRYAFDYARKHGRKKVLMADKSNVMSYAGGLWQKVFKQVAGEYSDITPQHMYVDALCLQMVREPQSLEVIVTNNMFGDISPTWPRRSRADWEWPRVGISIRGKRRCLNLCMARLRR